MDGHPASEIALRTGTVHDLPMLFRAERDYIIEREPDHLDEWTAAIDRNLELWIDHLDDSRIATVDGAPAGYVLWRTDGGDVTIITIHVFVEHRRRGIGGVLIAAVIEAATARGASAVQLGVHRDNPARLLYERDGFARLRTDGEYLFYALALDASAR